MTLRKRQRVVEPEQPESNVELQEAEPLFPTAQAEAQAMQAVDGQEIEIDSRPSDAIALGVAEDVPIYVAEHVLAETQADDPLDEADDDDFDLEWD